MHPNSLARASSPARPGWRALVAACVSVVFAGYVLAQAPAVEGGAPPPMPAEELDKLVAPIALYPDDLVAIVLPAATNPLQLVQADRFLDKRKADPKLPVEDKWDDSVKALLNYLEVVKKMSGDRDWTAALGEAVVADQGAVLEAIQVFRRKTQAVGNLQSDDKQVVVVEKEVISIVPANPEVIYVPQYNPATIVVAPPLWATGRRRIRSTTTRTRRVPPLPPGSSGARRSARRGTAGAGTPTGAAATSTSIATRTSTSTGRAERRRCRPGAGERRGNRTSDRDRSATPLAGRRRPRVSVTREPAGRVASVPVLARRHRPAAALAVARRRAHRSAPGRSVRRRATASAVRAPAAEAPRRVVP